MMIFNDFERRDPMGQNFLTNLRNYTRTGWPKTNKLGKVTHVGRSVFLVVQPATPPSQSGGTPALPNFSGFLLSMLIPFDVERTKLAW